MLVAQDAWRRTPSQVVGLNRGNPLTRDLHIAYYVTGSGAVEAARNLRATVPSGAVVRGNCVDLDEGDGPIDLGVADATGTAQSSAWPFYSSTAISAYFIATPRGLGNRRSLMSFAIGNAPVLAQGYTDSSGVFAYITNDTYLPEQGTGIFVDGQRASFGMTWASTRASPTGAFFKNGRRVAAVDHSGSSTTLPSTADSNVMAISATSGADRVGWQGTIELGLLWSRLLSDSEMAAVDANPWALFQAPSRKFWLDSIAASGAANLLVGKFGYPFRGKLA